MEYISVSEELLTVMLKDLNGRITKEENYMKLFFIPLIIEDIKLYFETKGYKELPKVAVFGPYGDGGEEILYTVAQKIASRGNLAIMGRGFYHPDAPTTFHEITELFPQMVKNFLPLKDFKFNLYTIILPSIVDKATVNLYPIRSQVYELEGCYKYGVPVLGYFIDESVSPQVNDCSYLETDSKGKIGQRCGASKIEQCAALAPHPPNCPFYNIFSITWFNLQWFIVNSSSWKLIALNNIDKIDGYLNSFL